MGAAASTLGSLVISFGPFRLFPTERLLKKGDETVPLGARALDILTALVQRPGDVLTQPELISGVWPTVTIEEANLRVHIAGLRKALGDGQAGARYIVNIPGRGYSFVAPVERSTTGRELPSVGPVDVRPFPRHGAGSLTHGVVSFGPFRLFPAERQLKKGDESLPLGGRSLDTLIALIERAGEVIAQRELISRVWPDATVEEANLRFHIYNLRKVLGDGREGARYIMTVAGRGYSFVAPVTRSTAQSSPPREAAVADLIIRLPPRLNRMIGRDDTVHTLSSQLMMWRFVSIVGAGGIGKTTVAISVAHALLDDFNGEVFFVDLAALIEPELVPTAVASALGFMLQTEDSLRSLAAFIGDKKILLVLDNCEHVIDIAAMLAERVVSEAPQAHVLTTSREALRVEGEHVHLLYALDCPPEDVGPTAAAVLPYAAEPPVGVRRTPVHRESPVTNFPVPLTRLIGRTTAVARLRDLMSAWRLVTLTGPGGIGKTSLALEAARGIVGEYAAGGWLVELASLSDPALVAAAVAGGLRVPAGPTNVTPETIACSIGDKKLLLVLDNCEHLIEAVAMLAETLLAHCPHITIIATSRETLRIQGEHVYRVPPLEVPAPGEDEAEHILNSSAVELFIARTEALGTGFSPRNGELPSVGAICRHLDGIPLAIEFAAAQASLLGTEQVAIALRNRFVLLTHGRRTALPRHRTLRGALDWSYELLPEPEQRLLRHLALFSGGFTVEAASAVLDDDAASVIEGIANLVAKSLVALDRIAVLRWYVLETIRAYALEKLAAHGEREAAARRHARYFHDLFPRSAPASGGGFVGDYRQGLARETDNVRVALNWCFSPGGDRALGVDLNVGHSLWLRVEVGPAMPDSAAGTGQSPEQFVNALDTAEAMNDLDAQARALVGIFNHHIFRAEHDRARDAALRVYRVASQMGDPGAMRNANRLMGVALVMLGRPREARQCLESFLRGDDPASDQQRPFGFSMQHRAPTRAFLSRALWLHGLIDQARQEAEASVAEPRGTEHPLELCRILFFGMCRILPMTGDFAAAERSIARLIGTAWSINSPFWETTGRFISGKLLIERGEFARGVAVLNDAFDTCRRTGWRVSYPEFRGALATGLSGLGRLDEALACANEALDGAVHGEHDRDLFFAELLRVKGEILLRCNAVTAAEDLFRRALDVAHEQEALFWELRAAVSLARLRVNPGRGDEARRLVAEVYGRFSEGFATPDLRAAKAFLDEHPG